VISIESPDQPEVRELIRRGDEFGLAMYPAASYYGLPLEQLLAPEVTIRVIERFARSLESEAGAGTGTEAAGTSPAAPATAEQQKLLDSLTSREREVLIQIAAGRSNAEIAREMFLAEATVKTHISNLLAKLGVSGRAEAVSVAHQRGLIGAG
jgi:DNA-binding NarL/FixJ family response regulator